MHRADGLIRWYDRSWLDGLHLAASGMRRIDMKSGNGRVGRTLDFWIDWRESSTITTNTSTRDHMSNTNMDLVIAFFSFGPRPRSRRLTSWAGCWLMIQAYNRAARRQSTRSEAVFSGRAIPRTRWMCSNCRLASLRQKAINGLP